MAVCHADDLRRFADATEGHFFHSGMTQVINGVLGKKSSLADDGCSFTISADFAEYMRGKENERKYKLEPQSLQTSAL